MAAGFPPATHLINRSDRPAVYLEAGTRREDVDEVDYPDIDMAVRQGPEGQRYVRKSGEPYSSRASGCETPRSERPRDSS
jgi:uncharacterized cupin superfamily protein